MLLLKLLLSESTRGEDREYYAQRCQSLSYVYSETTTYSQMGEGEVKYDTGNVD